MSFEPVGRVSYSGAVRRGFRLLDARNGIQSQIEHLSGEIVLTAIWLWYMGGTAVRYVPNCKESLCQLY